MEFPSVWTHHLVLSESTGSLIWLTWMTATVHEGVQLMDGDVVDETVTVMGSSHPPPVGPEESPQDATTSASDASMG
jgi:hypothetical protein